MMYWKSIGMKLTDLYVIEFEIYRIKVYHSLFVRKFLLRISEPVQRQRKHFRPAFQGWFFLGAWKDFLTDVQYLYNCISTDMI